MQPVPPARWRGYDDPGSLLVQRLALVQSRIAEALSSAPPGLDQVEAVCGDAGLTGAYAGLVPADIVLACGVVGNITEPAIERTIANCAQLCADGGSVVWARHRREPDLVPQICDWFAGQGFCLSYLSAPGLKMGVGRHRFAGQSRPLLAGARMFAFVSG